MNNKTLGFIILFICLTISTFADLEQARSHYSNGNLKSTFEEYSRWLDQNKDNPELGAVLIEISGLNGPADVLYGIIIEYYKYVENNEIKKQLILWLAEYYNLSGQISSAQELYEEAAFLELKKTDYNSLKNSAVLLIAEGEIITAKFQLEEVLLKSNSSGLKESAAIFLNIIALLGYGDFKAQDFKSYGPEDLYAAYIIYDYRDDSEKRDFIKDKMKELYPASPENKLINNKIKLAPGTLTSLGLFDSEFDSAASSDEGSDNSMNTENKAYLIQTGSFHDPENAEYLASDLKKAGFNPVVEKQSVNGDMFFKVLLYFKNENDMRSALENLRSGGFDGFPVY